MNAHPNFVSCPSKVFAFEDEGIKYYQFGRDGVPMYQERFVQMSEILRRHDEYKCTDATINEAITLIRAYTDNESLGHIKVRSEIRFIIDTLDERRKNNFYPQYHYDLAAVWYFDESEDPYGLDVVYCQEKIKRWLSSAKKSEIFFFILSRPLTTFIPYEQLSPQSILTYTQNLSLREYFRSKILLQKATLNGFEDGTLRSLELAMQTWELWSDWKDLQLSNITTTNESGLPSENEKIPAIENY